MDSSKAETNKKWVSSDSYRVRHDEIFRGATHGDESLNDLIDKHLARIGSLSTKALDNIKLVSPCAYKVIVNSYEICQEVKKQRRR